MTKDELKKIMQGLLEDKSHPLLCASIGIIRDGQILFAETMGTRYIDPATQNRVKADADTKYRMASISKLLTATGIWQLIEEGRLSPDLDAGEALGFPLRNPHFPDVPITIGMLLSHTSSIREGDDDVVCTYHIPYPHTVKEFFAKQSSCYYSGCWAGGNEAPGSYYSYCNFNYGLLGTIVEKVSGERFDHYMQNHVFQPLGLDCGFYVPSMTEKARASIGTLYRKLNDQGEYDPEHGQWRAQCDDFTGGYPVEETEYIPGTNATLFSPQGGLRASVHDMMKLMLAWMGRTDHAILTEKTIREMTKPVWTYDPEKKNGDNLADQCYARGPQVFLNRPGFDRLAEQVNLPFVGHGAGAYGLLGTLGMDLEKKNGILVVAIGTGGRYPGKYSRNNRWEEKMLTGAAEFACFSYP